MINKESGINIEKVVGFHERNRIMDNGDYFELMVATGSAEKAEDCEKAPKLIQDISKYGDVDSGIECHTYITNFNDILAFISVVKEMIKGYENLNDEYNIGYIMAAANNEDLGDKEENEDADKRLEKTIECYLKTEKDFLKRTSDIFFVDFFDEDEFYPSIGDDTKLFLFLSQFGYFMSPHCQSVDTIYDIKVNYIDENKENHELNVKKIFDMV